MGSFKKIVVAGVLISIAVAGAARFRTTSSPADRPISKIAPVATAMDARLARSFPETKFDAVGFEDVIAYLRDTTGANIYIDWSSLEQVGLHRATTISTRVRNLSFDAAMQKTFGDLCKKSTHLTHLVYTVDSDTIRIAAIDDEPRPASSFGEIQVISP